MKKVAGTYILKKKEISFDAQIPSNWADLEPKQFARIIEVLNFKKADPYTISVSLLALLFGSKNWHILQNLPDDLLTELVPLTNFLFEEKPPVHNFFSEININTKPHLAPANDLSNIGFGEWCFAHQYFIYYSITQDVTWLNKLIATIYRPKDENQNPDDATFSGDERQIFNENLIEKRSLSVASIEQHIKLAILAWFTVAVNDITVERPHVFPAPKVDTENPQPIDEAQNNQNTWLSVFRDLLGPKWGTEDKLKYTNAIFVLDGLEEKHIAFEEAKKGN